MREWQRQSHVKWYCRYHVVMVPKHRQKAIFDRLRKDIDRILRELCDQFSIELIEEHTMPDHVHLCLSIPRSIADVTPTGPLLHGSVIPALYCRHQGSTESLADPPSYLTALEESCGIGTL